MTIGHNSKRVKAGPVDGDKIKSYVDRIERLEDERKDVGSDIRDIYSEAKGNGYNPKALRKIIAQRRQKTDEELEADVELYRAALGMHGSYRKAAKALGVPKSTLHRLTVPREENGTPHDPETGEITDSRVASGADDCGAEVVQSEPAVSLAGEEEAPAPIIESCGAGPEQGEARSPGTSSGSLLQPGPQDPNADGMDIPAFLDRRRQVTA